MAGVDETDLVDVPTAASAQATTTRIFGWLVLAAMVAYLIDTYLTFFVGLPITGSWLDWQTKGAPDIWKWLQMTIYVALSTVAYLHVIRTDRKSVV